MSHATVTALSLALVVLAGIAYLLYRRMQRGGGGATTLFEASDPAAAERAVLTELDNGDLLIEAPVVHARLASGILVLDVKSEAQNYPEGFELALTEFDPGWLRAGGYGYHAAEGHVLLGPQGDISNRLLRRTARRHALDLPADAGDYVQAYPVQGVTTDPGDFCVHAHVNLPSGAVLNLRYDYAAATLRARVPASALSSLVNYQALGLSLRAA